MLIDVEGYDDKVISLAGEGDHGDVIEVAGLHIALPKKPPRKKILFHEKAKKLQMWTRLPVPTELLGIRSMDE